MDRIPITEMIAYHARRLSLRLVGNPEWSEDWRAWPHCNGQAGCWTHTSALWCACTCSWCRIARVTRPHVHRTTEQRRESKAKRRTPRPGGDG